MDVREPLSAFWRSALPGLAWPCPEARPRLCGLRSAKHLLTLSLPAPTMPAVCMWAGPAGTRRGTWTPASAPAPATPLCGCTLPIWLERSRRLSCGKRETLFASDSEACRAPSGVSPDMSSDVCDAPSKVPLLPRAGIHLSSRFTFIQDGGGGGAEMSSWRCPLSCLTSAESEGRFPFP